MERQKRKGIIPRRGNSWTDQEVNLKDVEGQSAAGVRGV